MSEDSSRAAMLRAARLKEFAEGPDGLTAIVAGLRAIYVSEFIASAPEDEALRKSAYYHLRILADLDKAIKTIINEGASAEQMSRYRQQQMERRNG